jgi:hypothetical protein
MASEELMMDLPELDGMNTDKDEELDIPELDKIAAEAAAPEELDIPELNNVAAGMDELDVPELAAGEQLPEAERSWLSKVIPREKLSELAIKYGKKESEIENLLNMKGALYESEEDLKIAEAAGDNPIAQALGTVASTGESLGKILPGMADSVAVGIPWKLMRESSNNPKLFDEIDRLAIENKGMLQSISEGAVEAGATGGIGTFALAKTGITGAAARQADKLKGFISKVFGGGKIATAAAKTGAGAVQLIPSSLATGAVGAAVGYGASRSGEEAEAARNFGALFAAMPYAGVGGAKIIGAAMGRPLGWVAKKLGIGVEEAIANFDAIEKRVIERAPTETIMLDIAKGGRKIADLADEELDDIADVLGKKNVKNIKGISRELKDEGYTGDIARRAKEIAVETALNKKLLSFTEEFIPLRTSIDKADFNIGDTINEFSQIESLSEMKRWIRLNKNMDTGIKARLRGTIDNYMDEARGTITEDRMFLDKVKSSLTTEWLDPMTRALKEAKDEGLPATVKFNSMADARKYLEEVNRAMADDPKYMEKLWLNFRSAEEVKDKLAGKAMNQEWTGINRVLNWVGARQFTLDSIDRRFGTSMALYHQRIMKKLDSFKYVIDGLKKETLDPLVKDYNDFLQRLPVKLRDERLFMAAHEGRARSFLIRAKELGIYAGKVPEKMKDPKAKLTMEQAMKIVGLTPDDVGKFNEFSASYSTVTKNLLDAAKDRFGLKIPEMKNYFRHQLVGSDIAYGRIINLFERVKGGIANTLTKKEHRKLLRENYNYRQLYLGLKTLYQLGDAKLEQKFGADAMEDAITQLEHMSSTQLSNRMGPNIYSAYRRTGGMPDILRETDPIKVLESWIANTVRGKFIREDMADIAKYIPILNDVGAKRDSAFVKDYIRNLMGGKPDDMGRQTARMRRVREIAKANATTPEKWEQMVVVPEQVQTLLTKIMQVNLLSSPFTALRNLEQVPFLTATEIGGSFGQYAAARGAMEGIYDWAIKKKFNIDDLYFGGKVPKELQSGLHSEILRPKTKLDKAQNIADRYGQALMFVFGKAEIANRMATIGTAKVLTREVATGSKYSDDVVKFVDSISSPALRKNLQKKLATLKEIREEVKLSPYKENKKAFEAAAADFGSDMEDYLLERTQFHYSKGNVSQAAEKFGPLFATFTRYTSEIQGDIVTKLRDGKNKEVLEKYLYPALYMTMFMNGISQATDDSKAWKNRAETVLGKSLMAHVPVSGATGMFSLLGQPAPAVTTVLDLYKAALSRNSRDITKAINDTTSFLPLYKPLENWIGKVGYRALGGADAGEDPITKTYVDYVRKPLVDLLKKDEGK